MNQSRVVNTFMQLVQIDSPTGHEQSIAKELVNFLEKMNHSASMDTAGNVILHIKSDSSEDPIFLSAHMDTVEPGRGIVPIIKNGTIHSQGNTILGADNKTAVAAILETIQRLSENDDSHPSLDVAFTVSEESGNHGAHGLDYSQINATKGYISDASGHNFGDIIIASPFYSRFDVTISGTPTHASTPESAVNALSIFNQAYQQLPIGRINEHTISNIGIVNCGQVINTIPGEVVCSGEVRSMVEDELEETISIIKNIFTQSSTNQKGSCQIDIIRENEGFLYEESDDFIQDTIKFLQQHNYQPKLIKSWGCYDANIFVENGIQVINIADGSQGAHTSSENVSIKNLENLADVFYQLVISGK